MELDSWKEGVGIELVENQSMLDVICQQCCDRFRGPLDKSIHQERVNRFILTNTK